MKKVTIRTISQDYYLKLDFNRKVKDVLEKIGIEYSSKQQFVTLLYKQVINPQLSFYENEIANNEIIEIKERYDSELWLWKIRNNRSK